MDTVTDQKTEVQSPTATFPPKAASGEAAVEASPVAVDSAQEAVAPDQEPVRRASEGLPNSYLQASIDQKLCPLDSRGVQWPSFCPMASSLSDPGWLDVRSSDRGWRRVQWRPSNGVQSRQSRK